jgi:hypothetical protein
MKGIVSRDEYLLRIEAEKNNSGGKGRKGKGGVYFDGALATKTHYLYVPRGTVHVHVHQALGTSQYILELKGAKLSPTCVKGTGREQLYLYAPYHLCIYTHGGLGGVLVQPCTDRGRMKRKIIV